MRQLLVLASFLSTFAFAGSYVCVTPNGKPSPREVDISGFANSCDSAPGKQATVYQLGNEPGIGRGVVLYEGKVDVVEEGTAHGTPWVPQRYFAEDGSFSMTGGWCGAQQRTVRVMFRIGQTWQAFEAECLYQP